MSLNHLFLEYHVKRAQHRKHRLCKKHNVRRTVCTRCARTLCVKCKDHVCPSIDLSTVEDKPKVPSTPSPLGPYVPPKHLKTVWKVLKTIGALRIEPHMDSGAYQALFPVGTLGLVNSSELADKLWQRSDLRAIAESTPWRAGKGNKPIKHWWVSFQLKEKRRDNKAA